MEVRNKFFMQEGTSRASKTLPAHKTGIVSYWYSICTQRYKCIKKCVCVCVFKYMYFGLITVKHVLFFFKFVQGYTHTAGRHGVWGVWSKSERTCWMVGWLQPRSPLLQMCEAFMRANLEGRRKKTLIQKKDCNFKINFSTKKLRRQVLILWI